ncbi:MAG: hypothetical protein KDE27_32565, partial [Planctomycetes bacterium]|nr:hypothetical protein [Planctomycetota bacterium]
MPDRRSLLAAIPLFFAAALAAQVQIQPPFAGVYVHTDLGSVPGLPVPYGGVVFKANDPSKLLVGGNANNPAAAIYEVDVVRDNQGFITGFTGSATVHSTAPNIDGGLCYGPNGVLFYTAYNINVLGQIKPGSTAPDKLIGLTQHGVLSSTGACNFVPNGFPGAGQLKIVSFNSWTYYGFAVSPDGTGTFDIAAINGPTMVAGGPEGILYVPPGSALIPDYQYVLISEWSAGEAALYQVDADGNAVGSSRTPFVSGLSGAEGACTDPITGDLVFSTFNGGDRIFRITGFGVCGSHTNYGVGIPGQNGAPTIAGGGCAGRGQITTIDVANGRPSTSGLLAVGFDSAQIPVFNGALLVSVVNSFFHVLDASGQWSLAVQLPIDPLWNGLNIYSQSFYVDPAAQFGVAATDGL